MNRWFWPWIRLSFSYKHFLANSLTIGSKECLSVLLLSQQLFFFQFLLLALLFHFTFARPWTVPRFWIIPVFSLLILIQNHCPGISYPYLLGIFLSLSVKYRQDNDSDNDCPEGVVNERWVQRCDMLLISGSHLCYPLVILWQPVRQGNELKTHRLSQERDYRRLLTVKPTEGSKT